ncbi:hypothetical protein AOC36_04265 [Erysipelothrix larvae]|uniref:D-alanine--D-alanine ligase n=1 Tax=Erysipelothrix larvae TaxID=1514105 RepID=A0A109UGS8_9FIRM|nr:D-alanine--D-alanine ligase family protein [Erysipelothrix larvae]AMC93212.1 hypothetical protein AOC36_04265 [Erysipelothrix larvae]
MNKKRILLFFGSQDSEHDISIKTAQSIFEFFPSDEFTCYPIYIKKTGEWIHGKYTLDSFKNKNFEGQEVFLRFDSEHPGIFLRDTRRKVYADGAFLALHGPTGEGGHIQGLLDMAMIPYTGSDLLASVTSMDKALTHQILEGHGIKMTNYQCVSSIDDIDIEAVDYPVIVKPSREGSSFGVSSAHDYEELLKACEEAFKYDTRILIETFVRGSEASIAVLDTNNHKIVSEPVQTILKSEFFSFEDKYITDDVIVHYDATYSDQTKQKLKDLSLEIFDIMGARHLSRLDFFVTEDETIYFNEINTMPGFTSTSFYPILIANEGLEYTDLIRTILQDVVNSK